MMRRLVVLLLAVGLLVTGPALAASAAPQPVVGPVAMKACAPAPEPASPFAGLPGKLYGKPATASDADPFTDPGVNIADVYGYDYAWVDYDNGCIPGSDVLPKAQTGIANFLTAGAASVSAFTHSLFSLVVRPDFMSPLDGVLTDATDAIKGGFWDPWVTVILILVAAGVLLAAARSEVSTAVTTVGWALLVLVGATFIMSYPVASAQAVDSLVQTTVAASARGIGVDDGSRTDRNSARSAIDSMFDTINRDTYYNAWLEGTLGSADSAVAREYGPDLFRASHLTWSEAETVRDDPGAGRAIVDAKKALWVKTAAAVEGADSGAYAQLTGEKGRWDATAMVVLRVGLMMPFLVVAAIFIVIAYVATRVFVPLAPGLAVVGLLYSAQGWVIRVLKQVGRFIILGPVFFVAALANLLLDTAVLDSDLAFPLQLVIVAAIPFVLFKLLRPGHAMPGSRSLGRMARASFGTLVSSLATRKAVASGVNNAKKKNDEDDDEGVDLRRDPAPYSYYYPKNGPVAMGDTLALTAGEARPRELPAGRRYELGPAPSTGAHARRGNESPIVQSGGHELPRRTRRELTAIGAGPEPGGAVARTGGTFVAGPDGDVAAPTGPTASGPERPPAHRAPEFGNHPAIRPDKTDVDLSAPADKNVVPVEVVKDRASPASLVEATTTYDADGNPVFQIWRPPAARAADEPEEQR